MTTPPCLPPLYIVLQALKNDFELTDEQLAALPSLDEVDLAPQSDSRLIEHAEPGVFTYHPYKLFIGKHDNDLFYAYLQRKSVRKRYQIELCSVNIEEGTHYAPIRDIYFGTVNNLAYPFVAFLGSNRFAAIVKWYFLLAFQAGEFDEDPGFSVTASWTKELQGACNDLIAAPGIEATRRLRDREKVDAEMKRAVGRDRKKRKNGIRRRADYRETDAVFSKPGSQADDRPQRTSTRKESARTTEHKHDKDLRDHRPRRDRQTGEEAATEKDKINEESTVATEERPRHRRKTEHAAKGNGGEALDGTADDREAEQEDDTDMSWSQEVERLTSFEEDETTEDHEKGEASAPLANEQALREAAWMRLFRLKVETTRQMRDLEDGMTINERLEVFDKVKYA